MNDNIADKKDDKPLLVWSRKDHSAMNDWGWRYRAEKLTNGCWSLRATAPGRESIEHAWHWPGWTRLVDRGLLFRAPRNMTEEASIRAEAERHTRAVRDAWESEHCAP